VVFIFQLPATIGRRRESESAIGTLNLHGESILWHRRRQI
jgi:hypothetical protein